MPKGQIRITITSPVKKDLVFAMIHSKMLKEFNKAQQGKKTKLDSDVAEAIRQGKIMLDTDIDNYTIYYNMEGTKDEIKKWSKMSLKDRILSRGIKKVVKIEVIK